MTPAAITSLAALRLRVKRTVSVGARLDPETFAALEREASRLCLPINDLIAAVLHDVGRVIRASERS